MIAFGLDPAPGEIIYFSLGNREYALACRPEESCLLPSGSGGSNGVSGRCQVRQLSGDLPAGYTIKAKGELFFVFFQGRQIGWAGDLAGAQGLVEHDLGERSQRVRFVNRSARNWEM